MNPSKAGRSLSDSMRPVKVVQIFLMLPLWWRFVLCWFYFFWGIFLRILLTYSSSLVAVVFLGFLPSLSNKDWPGLTWSDSTAQGHGFHLRAYFIKNINNKRQFFKLFPPWSQHFCNSLLMPVIIISLLAVLVALFELALNTSQIFCRSRTPLVWKVVLTCHQGM